LDYLSKAGMAENKRILVVEDDPVLRMLAAKQLEQLGYPCETVGSGEEAMQVLAADSFKVIFMDIGLPGMDGIATAKAIRDKEQNDPNEEGCHLYIIGLTAHSERQACLKAGMDDFLQKPALINDMKQILEKYIPQQS
jgi:CheY-like chemotaxis protein